MSLPIKFYSIVDAPLDGVIVESFILLDSTMDTSWYAVLLPYVNKGDIIWGGWKDQIGEKYLVLDDNLLEEFWETVDDPYGCYKYNIKEISVSDYYKYKIVHDLYKSMISKSVE